MEIRTQKKVRLGGLGRWGRGSPLFGGMAGCGNEDLPKGAPDIRRSPDSFLQLLWVMLLLHQTVSDPPKPGEASLVSRGSRVAVSGLGEGPGLEEPTIP